MNADSRNSTEDDLSKGAEKGAEENLGVKPSGPYCLLTANNGKKQRHKAEDTPQDEEYPTICGTHTISRR